MKLNFLNWNWLCATAVGLILCGCSQGEPSAAKNESDQTSSPMVGKGTTEPDQQTKTENGPDDPKESASPKKAVAKNDEPDVNDPRFHDAIKQACDEYLRFALVNPWDQAIPQPMVAPALCAAPIGPSNSLPQPKFSEAEEGGHARKLYFLFAKDIANYFDNQVDAPVGQVLVKESWTSKPSNAEARNLRNHASANRINPRTKVDGKILEISKRKSLFVMLKQDPETEGTDEGWVYGVMNPETKTILASGRVASCMACHVDQKDRMFRKGIETIVEKPSVDDDALNDKE